MNIFLNFSTEYMYTFACVCADGRLVIKINPIWQNINLIAYKFQLPTDNNMERNHVTGIEFE